MVAFLTALIGLNNMTGFIVKVYMDFWFMAWIETELRVDQISSTMKALVFKKPNWDVKQTLSMGKVIFKI